MALLIEVDAVSIDRSANIRNRGGAGYPDQFVMAAAAVRQPYVGRTVVFEWGGSQGVHEVEELRGKQIVCVKAGGSHSLALTSALSPSLCSQHMLTLAL